MPPKKPSKRHAAFVEHYLVSLNATEAARLAGYSARVANREGYRLLKDPRVAAAIAAATEARSKRLQITQDSVLLELARVVFADPRKLVKPDGTPLAGLHELDDDTAHAIGSVKWEQTPDEPLRDAAGQAVVNDAGKPVMKPGARSIDVRFVDKGGAIANAMRHLGMFNKDRVKLEGLESLQIVIQRKPREPAPEEKPEPTL